MQSEEQKIVPLLIHFRKSYAKRRAKNSSTFKNYIFKS
jgi:hypothetical protein